MEGEPLFLGPWPPLAPTAGHTQAALTGVSGVCFKLSKETRRGHEIKVDMRVGTPGETKGNWAGGMAIFLCKCTLNCQRIKIYK